MSTELQSNQKQQKYLQLSIRAAMPEGYWSIEDSDYPRMIMDGLVMQKISRLVSKDQIVFIYKLSNTKNIAKHVSEHRLNIANGDWIFLDRKLLKPQESAVVLIGCLRCVNEKQ